MKKKLKMTKKVSKNQTKNPSDLFAKIFKLIAPELKKTELVGTYPRRELDRFK